MAAVSDLHCTRTSHGVFQPLLAQMQAAADILVLAGDLTDHGLPEEAHVLAKELAAVHIPMVAVLGNHDYHHSQPDEIERILATAGVQILDGDDCEVLGIGFAGVKGFGGGFGRLALEAWGEDGIKKFVYEAVEEALKLEKALRGCAPPSASRSCITRRFRRPSRANRRRCGRSWVRAGWRSRSIAMPSRPSCMATPTTAARRARR